MITQSVSTFTHWWIVSVFHLERIRRHQLKRRVRLRDRSIGNHVVEYFTVPLFGIEHDGIRNEDTNSLLFGDLQKGKSKLFICAGTAFQF